MNEKYPLLILNPPQGTKIKEGDYIISLGSIPSELILKTYQDKVQNHEKAPKKEKDTQKLK